MNININLDSDNKLKKNKLIKISSILILTFRMAMDKWKYANNLARLIVPNWYQLYSFRFLSPFFIYANKNVTNLTLTTSRSFDCKCLNLYCWIIIFAARSMYHRSKVVELGFHFLNGWILQPWSLMHSPPSWRHWMSWMQLIFLTEIYIQNLIV